jgi:hypothetical protein
MGVSLSEAWLEVGTTSLAEFTPSCTPGDWVTWRIPFTSPGLKVPPAVIVTPNNRHAQPDDHIAAPVGVAQHVTAQGFILAARNSDCAAGVASFDWLAISTADRAVKPNVTSVRMRVVQPMWFSADCTIGDTQGRELTFWDPVQDDNAFVFLTASDSGVFGEFPNGRDAHNAAAVGRVMDSTLQGFLLSARNSDSASGRCAFYSSAIDMNVDTVFDNGASLFVDVGTVNVDYILASLSGVFTPGSWISVAVDFHQPYREPPVVLLTANDDGVSQAVAGTGTDHNAAVVGIATNVTPNGFILSARNSDCAPRGTCGFYWVAIGCGPGCG